MPCRQLANTQDVVLHVVNRGARRLRLFDSDQDYRAFLQIVAEGRARTRIRLLTYCVMPNHYHLVVWPTENGQLPAFMHWFQGTHGKRWHEHRRSVGSGAVYQSRYRASPVQTDSHLLAVCRYVERNPLRAGLVRRAENWPWSRLGSEAGVSGRNCDILSTDPWPILRPRTWVAMVNEEGPVDQLKRIREAIVRGASFGEPRWARATDGRLGLTRGRPRGRPPRQEKTPGVISGSVT